MTRVTASRLKQPSRRQEMLLAERKTGGGTRGT